MMFNVDKFMDRVLEIVLHLPRYDGGVYNVYECTNCGQMIGDPVPKGYSHSITTCPMCNHASKGSDRKLVESREIKSEPWFV